MNQYYPHLWSPIQIGSLTVKNRIQAGPVNPGNLPLDGFFSKENVAAFELKARGGAGIVTFGESYVHMKTGAAHPRVPQLDNEEVLPHLAAFSGAMHRHGALASIELSHPGRRSNKNYYHGTIWGPSDGYGIDKNHVVKEMPIDVIEEVIEAFGDAAEIAKLGGMDMVMVHMGHGWLIHQFMSPLTNFRTDEYGGSLENRFRFALRVIDNIKKKCGEDFPIDLRISGSEVTPEGLTIEDMKKFARAVDGKVAMINVSEGTFHIPSTTSKNHPSMLLPPGCNTYLATAVKSAVKKTKISAVGGIVHPDMMEDIIAAGKADMIALIRALIADPDLPRKARDGRANDITPCQRCLVCLSDDFVPYVKYPTHTAKCTVNPIIGRETEVLATVPTEGRKRALIAGGGPAGMQAALTASKRGHQVILCEQGTELGGAIRYAKHVSFKEALDRFMRVLVARVESDREIMLMLNTKVTPELAKQLEPDVLVAAIGAQAIVPQIPGIDRPHVIQAVGMHDRMIQGEPIGENVVIIGGGLVGCEEALDLARKGHTVTVVEMREAVAINSAFLHRHALLLELETFDTVKLLVKTQCKEILDVGVCVVCEDEEEVLPSDTVIISVGMRPLCDEVESLRECAPDFQVIGDSWQPRRVQEAIKMGYDVGMHI